jgi:membrane protein
MQKTWYLLKQTFIAFIEDKAIQLSAALSYYTIFALPPLLIIIISLIGIFFGADAVRGEIFGQIKGFVGNTTALQIQEMIKNTKLSGSNTFATITGIIILIIVASGMFTEIQDSINYIWRIKTKPRHGLIKFMYNRLMSFSMIGSVGIILIVVIIINSLMDILGSHLEINFQRDAIFIFYVVNLIILYIIITLFFTLIFKALPDGKIALRDCIIGASFTAFLFMIGKFVIGFYLGRLNVTSVYGATGSVILILTWIYYSAILLYFGAEFTKIHANMQGRKIIPNNYSVQMKQE